MEINLNQTVKHMLSLLLMIIIPLILILAGVIAEYHNAWLYILSITWFATGVIFFASVD